MLPSPLKSSESTASPTIRSTDVLRGTLTVVSGCMFSGKTTELIRRIDAAHPAEVRAFKHHTDDRYCATRIVSHAGKSVSAIDVRGAGEMLRYVLPRTTLAVIDEGHFFDARLLDAVQAMTRRGVEVVIAALQPDSWGRPFPLVEKLIALADAAVEKRAHCARCHGEATRTQRLTPVVDGKMVVDPSNYEPRCVKCWTPPPCLEPT